MAVSKELRNALRKIVPPPRVPDRVQGTCLNPAFGPSIELPADYLWFMKKYGPGWFMEVGSPVLEVLDLVSLTHAEEVHDFLAITAGNHDLEPERFGLAYPHVPGLLPWGSFDQGDTFSWFVVGQADDWRVFISNPRAAVAELTDLTMVEFICEWTGDSSKRRRSMPQQNQYSGFCPASQYANAFKKKRKHF